MTLHEELTVKHEGEVRRRALLRKAKEAILAGDWAEVEKMCVRKNFKNYKPVLYAVYKQQFLELIDAQVWNDNKMSKVG